MRMRIRRSAKASVRRLAAAFWKLPSWIDDHEKVTGISLVTPPSVGPIWIWRFGTIRFHALTSGSSASDAPRTRRVMGRARERRLDILEPEIDERLERHRKRPRQRQHIDHEQHRDSEHFKPKVLLMQPHQPWIKPRCWNERDDRADRQRQRHFRRNLQRAPGLRFAEQRREIRPD